MTTLPAGIGGGNALSSLTTDVGGTTVINGPIFTTGAITFNDAASGNNVTLNAGTGALTALNSANDFLGVTTLTGGAIQVKDVNALSAVLSASGASTLIAGDNLVLSGTTAGLTTTTTGTGTTNFGATTVSGNLAATSASAVAQTGALLVSGTTNINAGSNPINLTNAGNDFSGPAMFAGSTVQVFDLNALSAILATSGPTTLTAGGNLSVSGNAGGLTTTAGSTTDFGATTVSGSLTVTSPSGAVTQSGPLLVSGTSDFNAGTNAITLTHAANDFAGPVTLTGGTVQVTDVNALTAQLTTSGAAILNAGGNLLIASASTAGLTTITTGTGTTQFGSSTNVTGNLAVTSAGAVSQSGPLSVTGNSTLNAGTNAITLANANNDFSGPLSLTGGTTQINDKNALTLGTLNTSALTVTSTGALNLGQGTVGGALIAKSNNNTVTQAGALTVSGIADINAGTAPITLTNANNDFIGAVSVTGGAVQLTDKNTLPVGNLTAGSLTLAAANTTLQGALNTSGAFNLPSGIFTINPGASLTTTAATIAAGATLATGGSFTATGPVTVGGILKGSATGPILATGQPVNVISGGTLDLNGGSVTASAVNNQGLLKGLGTINSNVFNDGTFSPGASPGLVNIVGNYVQGATGLLNIEIGGTTPGTGFDQLAVTGNATLNGVLALVQFGGFVPASTNGFRFLTTGGTISGAFSTVLVPTAFAGMSLSYQSQFTDALASPIGPGAPASAINTLIAATQQPILIVEENKPLTEEEKKNLGPSCSP